jgi:HEPN domain-containing protein
MCFSLEKGDKMENRYLEWLKQADYDMETAEYMHKGGRHFYSVFMCHLSIEKALKALYQYKLGQLPPKTHSLVYLLQSVGLKPLEAIGRFIIKLNESNIATRYPEDLQKLQDNYTEAISAEIILNSKDTLQWIKKQF